MKNILLTSIAILLLQWAVSANSEFSNANLHGTFGYNFLGRSGDQGNAFLVETGVLKADGYGNLQAFGTTLISPSGLPQEIVDVIYDCTYNVEPKGAGKIDCLLTQNEQNQFNLSFSFALDINCSYLNRCKEIRLISLPSVGEEAHRIGVIGSAYMQK